MIQCPVCKRWFKSKKALAGHRSTCKPKTDVSEYVKKIEHLQRSKEYLNGLVEQLIEEAKEHQAATKKRIEELEAECKTLRESSQINERTDEIK